LEIIDDKVPGLRVRIAATGLKTFIIRKRVHGGKVQVITVGTYQPPRFDLAAARKKARTIISDLEAGKGAPKHTGGNKALTVSRLLPDYYSAKASNRSIGQTRSILEKHVVPYFGDRLADTITRGEETRFIDSLPSPSVARSTFAALSSFYGWAMPRLDRLPANPCRDAGRPKALPSRDRVLSDAELRALMLAGDDVGYPFGMGAKLLLLTAARRSEVFEAQWCEFDLPARLWTIPGNRSKNGLAHVVPLSDAAMEVIEALPQLGRFLFPAREFTDRPMSGFSKGAAALRVAVDKRLVVWL
jgi:integrase